LKKLVIVKSETTISDMTEFLTVSKNEMHPPSTLPPNMTLQLDAKTVFIFKDPADGLATTKHTPLPIE
jgi:hypothetical protein